MSGQKTKKLECDISKEEVYQAILECKKESTPEDGVSNINLRNLEQEQVEALVEHINKRWKPSYHHSGNIRTIQKPGKHLAVENLRPITLTSCLERYMRAYA